MISFPTCLFGMLLIAAGEPTPSDIARARGHFWCDSCSGNQIRVEVDFQLKVERPDPALATAFFPVAKVNGDVVNLLRWSEDVTRGGPRYRIRYNYPELPGSRAKVPTSFQQTYLFNGRNSWKFEPDYRVAEQGNDRSRGTRFFQDYYGDMIGSELAGIARPLGRTVPSGTEEPYDLNQVVGSGLYQLAGTEVVAAEPCVIIERSGWDRVWLATRKNFVVVRREWHWTGGGPLKRRITNTDWREATDGVWLPLRCQMDVMGHPTTRAGQRVGVLTATVREMSTAISDDDFEPHFPKGTRVFDLETGKPFPFGLSAAELDAQARVQLLRSAAQPELARFAYQPAAWWQQPWAWFTAGGTILGASLVLWLRWRERQ